MSNNLGSKLNKKPIFRAHNPKAVGSNPAPATKEIKGLRAKLLSPFLLVLPYCYPSLFWPFFTSLSFSTSILPCADDSPFPTRPSSPEKSL